MGLCTAGLNSIVGQDFLRKALSVNLQLMTHVLY